MSFILVTFGYNQYNLFNIKSSTPTLIDKIKEVAFQNINQKLFERDKQLQKEIESLNNEEEKIHKLISATEQDLQIEKDKYDLAVKQLEAKKKKEELEQKKKEAAEKAAAPKGKNKKEEAKQSEKKKGGKNDPKKNDENETIDETPMNDLKDKISKLNNDLSLANNNKNIYIDKKTKLQDLISTYKKKYKDRMNIKIDLADAKGEKVNISLREDTYANEYLIEKTCYELFSFNEVVVNNENKDSKKNTKKDFKKEDKKKQEEKEKAKEKEKDKDKKDEKENEEPVIEYVLEPVKIDGYCFRSVQEDEENEEGEKGKDKKGKKK